jgi:hypothetical protein
MRLTFGDAIGSALDSVRGIRWTEYAPFFWILALEGAFLLVSTQLQSAWAMSLVAPFAKLLKGADNLHYPVFFGYLPVLLSWLENFSYAVLGAVLIPMSILRLYARTDRALSLGAGAMSRLAGAFVPTLLAGLAWVGAGLGWQRYAAAPLGRTIHAWIPGPAGSALGWLAVALGAYAILTLLLYVPVAAVQARSNPIRAIGYGIRFGLRSWPLTMVYAVLFGAPAIVVQFVIEKQGVFLISRLRPEMIAVLLFVYVAVTSVGTYLTYITAARLYKIARGEE